MKTTNLFIGLFCLLCSTPILNAQIYTPNGDIQGASGNNNVGIGTTSPKSKLHVQCADYGPVNAEDRSAIYGNNTGNNSGYPNSIGIYGKVKASQGIAVYGYSANSNGYGGYFTGRGYFSGNVGIGTTSPSEKLHVNGSIRGNQSGALRINTGNGYVDIGPKNSNWAHFYTDRSKFYFDKEIRINSGYIGSYDENLSLRTSGNTRMTILKSNGNIGIGTSNPTSKLTVNGKIESKELEVKDDLNVTAGPDDDADIILTDASGKFGWIAQDKATDAMWIEHAEGQKLMLSGQYGADGVVVVKGKLGIGTSNPTSKLTVNGKIECEEIEVKILASNSIKTDKLNLKVNDVADYVFEKDYDLKALEEVEIYINDNKHLPDIPSAEELEEKGMNVAEMNNLLLKKIEELTLYVIEQEKRIKELEKQ